MSLEAFSLKPSNSKCSTDMRWMSVVFIFPISIASSHDNNILISFWKSTPVSLSIWSRQGSPTPCYSVTCPVQYPSYFLGTASGPARTFNRTMRKSCALSDGAVQQVEWSPALLMDIFTITWGDPSWKERQQLREQHREIERIQHLMAFFGFPDPAMPKVIASPKLLSPRNHYIFFRYMPLWAGSLSFGTKRILTNTRDSVNSLKLYVNVMQICIDIFS